MTAQSSVQWLRWQDLPWTKQTEAGVNTVQLCEDLIQDGLEPDTVSLRRYLQRAMPKVATEFSFQWVTAWHRTPKWEAISEFGRAPSDAMPFGLFEEVLDRESGACCSLEDSAGWTMFVTPFLVPKVLSGVFAFATRNGNSKVLAHLLAVSQAITAGAAFAAQKKDHATKIERLQSTLEIASSMASVRESEPLLNLIAEEATKLLECDRASIFVWDRERREVIACPALGVEGGSLRIPDNVGVVGDVIHSGNSARVDDAYNDSRFDHSVDKKSGYKTDNLLCWPMKNPAGELIGAFEVINKLAGKFSEDDEESLSQLSNQAAIAILNTQEREQLIRSKERLTEQVAGRVRIVGESPAIVSLKSTIERLAATDLPVLILGPSGTGKEVVAQALHYYGPRGDHPFVAVNCAALTESLLESELFGHEKGAFTDAHDTRQGKFELAEGGTLFLDEIGDMSLGGQAKLLRVLEQKVVTRVGGTQTIPINVRILAATNANLSEKVEQKKFREDLYYRLSVVTQHLPPLVERPEDILPLAKYFLKEFCEQANRKTMTISADAKRRLQAHPWPGNVRELRNLMERVAFLGQENRVESDDLAFILSPGTEVSLQPNINLGLADATNEFQRSFIQKAIQRVRGNMSEAARLMGLHRSNLYRKMRQLEMKEATENEA